MVSTELLEKLVCPVERKPLSMLSQEEADALKADLVSGKVVPVGSVDWRLDEVTGFLVTRSRKVAYPVVDGIPSLLPDSRIVLSE